MTSSKPGFDLCFVPWGTGADPDAEVGAAWLREQPGTPVVFAPLKSNFRDSRLDAFLPGVQVLTERQAHNGYWAGGPMLIVWPDENMVGRVSHQYASRLTAACVLEWSADRSVRAWLVANGAIDLITGEPFTEGAVTLPPVVEVAMRQLNETVNHSNGLAGYADERDPVGHSRSGCESEFQA